jgi:hypothetical protein
LEKHLTLSSVQRAILPATAGLSLFFLAMLVDVRITATDPLARFSENRVLLTIVSIVHLTAILSYWASISGVITASWRSSFYLASGFAIGAVVCGVSATHIFRDYDFDDFMRFTMGSYTFVILIGLAAVSLPIALPLFRCGGATNGSVSMLVGPVSVVVGLIVHLAVGTSPNAAVMLAKVVLLLLVPAASSIIVAIHGSRTIKVRLLYAMAAAVAIFCSSFVR